MAYTRLGESVQTLYAELLDQLRTADAEAAVRGLAGTFVSKNIRGRTYWYLQRSEGATKRQIYLGPESRELLAQIDAASTQRALAAADEKRRRELVTMLQAGGLFRETAAIGVVLRVLADASVFRAGGVLVGTQAFTTIANMLGVSLPPPHIDADVTIPLVLADTLQAIEPAPSTSFKVRGRDLRVDFLIPARNGGRNTKPVYLPHLRVAAQPLRGLDYVIEDSVDAAVIAGSGIRVNVPSPARFAFHKLWVASERPASEAAKTRKDLRQAEQLLEVLLDDRPDDLTDAWEALTARRGMTRSVKASLQKLAVRERLRERLRG